MAYCPFGFHVGPGGNRTGIGTYFDQLHAAARPVILKSVDDYGICRDLVAKRRQDDVPHVIVYRKSGADFEIPNYDLPPDQAAESLWQKHVANLPPEFIQHNDKEHVWLEIINEPDKDRAGWIGWFMFHIAQLALDGGYKVAGAGWSTGTPEPEAWHMPGWVEYLKLCARHPDQIAIALHEYSLELDDILAGDGFLVGRVKHLFAACDSLAIARPTVLITEWGWTHNRVPAKQLAMRHIRRVAEIYREHPQILGAAIWYLGGGFEGIANRAQKLIKPVTEYALSDEWTSADATVPDDDGEGEAGTCRGTPRVQYDRVYRVLHDSVSEQQALTIFRDGLANKRTIGWSFDDAGIGDLDNRTAEMYGVPPAGEPTFVTWYREHYPGVKVLFKQLPTQPGRLAMLSAQDEDTSDCRGTPRVQYERVYQVLHGSVTDEQAVAIFRNGLARRRTTGWSFDDAGIGDLDRRIVEIYGCPPAEEQDFRAWYAEHYPGVNVLFKPVPGTGNFWLANPVSRDPFITSFFDEPRDYDGDGFPEQKHEGIDFAGLLNGQRVKVLAAQSGTVTRVRRQTTGYGHHVIIRHDWPDGHTYFTWYGHLSQIDVEENDTVGIRQQIGVAGDTGNADGIHLHLNLQHIGHGLPGYVIPDVVDPLPFLRDDGGQPPPPTGTAQMGLHATADTRLAAGEIGVFQAANIELVKVLSHIHPGDLAQLRDALPGAKWIVRAFLDFGGRDISPAQFVNDTIGDVQRTLGILSGKDVVVELHNEPNLSDEGLGASWADGAEFRVWFLEVLSRYRNRLPGLRYLYPGLSPGPAIPGRRQEHMSFLNQSVAAVAEADGLAVHLYWAHDFPMSNSLQMLDDYLDFMEDHNMRDKPIWVTEASNNKGGTPPNQKGNEYIIFWRELRERRQVQGVTYFVASASNPAFAEEVWVANGAGRGIAQVVGAR